MSTTRRTQWLLAIIVFVALAFLPVIDQPYWLTIGISILMYGVLATSWALFSGPTHYISLATAAFYGLGAYVVGMGIESVWYPFLLVIATALGALLALVVGWATLRLSGVYFVIFTLGLAEFIRQIITWVQNNFTGSRGVYVLTSIEDKHIFWELLVLAAVVCLFGVWLKQSRLGFALRVIGGGRGGRLACRYPFCKGEGAAVLLLWCGRGFDRRDFGATPVVYRTVDGFFCRSLVPSGHHGTVRRRTSTLGANCGRDSVYVPLGVHCSGRSHTNRSAVGRRFPRYRVFHPARYRRPD